MTISLKTTRRVALGCAAAAGVMAAAAGASWAQDKPYEGITINVLTRPGPVIAGRLAERGVEFQEMTGAEVRVAEVPFSELFPSLITDWSTGTNSIDVGVFSSAWGVEMAADGLIENLDPYLANDDLIDVDDIAPYFREYNQKVGGSTYMLTIDGDFQMLYYRTDVLGELGLEPPKHLGRISSSDRRGRPWQGHERRWRAGLRFLHVQEAERPGLLRDACRSPRQYRAEPGHRPGDLSSTPTTMTPMVNNAAWAAALNFYKATGEYGPPDELNHDIGDTRALVQAGRCAQMIDWGDIGPLSIDPEGDLRSSTRWAQCRHAGHDPRSSICESGDAGRLRRPRPARMRSTDGINHAPFAAFGGWSGAINTSMPTHDVKEAAYAFLSYMNQAAQSNVRRHHGLDRLQPLPELAVREP